MAGRFVTIEGRPVFIGGPSQGGGGASPGQEESYKQFGSDQEAMTYFTDNYTHFIEELPYESKARQDFVGAIRDYTGEGYYDINKSMRNSGINYNDKTQYEIISAMNSSDGLPEGVTVMRGYGGDFFKDKAVGSTFIDNAFISTTVKPNGLDSFPNSTVLLLPKGLQALYLGNVSNKPNEAELLLPPGLKYRVVKNDNEGTIIQVSEE